MAKNSGGNADRPKRQVPMRVPKHGGGKLLVGGTGAGGRPPSVIKALALEGLSEALPKMRELAKGDDAVAVQAFNALAKVSGVDGRISPADVRERLKAQVQVIRSRDTWSPDELLTALGEVWR